jgi:YfiR/HmsC-like
MVRLMIVLLIGATGRAGEAPVPEEYQVKGAFLLNFVKFVEWPAKAFKEPGDPIAICVLGQNPFGPGLDQAAHAIVVGKRSVSVRQVADAQQAGQCQIVFVSVSERRRAHAWLKTLQGGNVLTVGESEDFLANGGVIAFKLDGEKVRIEISTAAADRAGLHISAKLLSLAQSGKK